MQLVDSKCKGRLNLKEKEGFNIRLNLAGGNYWYNMRGTTGTTWGNLKCSSGRSVSPTANSPLAVNFLSESTIFSLAAFQLHPSAAFES